MKNFKTCIYMWITLCCFMYGGVANGATLKNTTIIPLSNENQWIELKFNSLPANAVSYTNRGLTIAVDKSASPLIHQLPAPIVVSHLRVRAKINGTLNLTDANQQGNKGQDDYVFRLGLVEAGTKTLSAWQTPFAAKWIKQLFALAPDNSGINKIEFFNVPESSLHVGHQRTHPASNLLLETILDPADADGNIVIDLPLDEPIETLALWISSDGDDTQSQYQITISMIELFSKS